MTAAAVTAGTDVTSQADKDIPPEASQQKAAEGAAAAPEQTEAEQAASTARAFLGYLKEVLSSEENKEKREEACHYRAKVTELGQILHGSVKIVADGFGMPGPSNVEDALNLIWIAREDPEVYQKAKDLEEMLGIVQGSMFLMDYAVEPKEEPQAKAFDIHRGRDLAWKLVKNAELTDCQRSLNVTMALWTSEELRAYGKQAVQFKHLYPVLEEFGFSGQEPTAFGRTQTAWAKMMPTLKACAADPEVAGYSWRFEKAWGLASGSFLVKKEETGGYKFPKFASYPYVEKVHWWERFNVDSAYLEDGEGMVIPPEAPDPGPRPVLLFLLGHGHFNSRQRFIQGEIEDLLQHETIRKQFWIIVPKPDTRNGMAYWLGRRFEKDWQEDAVWYFFSEVVRKLGPEKCDNSRFYITGVSQGGAGTWHMCMKYGRYFAAAMPSGGASTWPGDTWPTGGYPNEKALEELRKVPFRAIHVDSDNHAPPPKKDIEFLTYRLEERECDIQAFGFDMVKRFNINIRKWFWEGEGEKFIEYWAVEGPLDDGRNVGAWKDDRHLIWIRTWVNPYWGVASFFLENQCPEERRWKFDDPPAKPDSSEHKAFLDRRGYFDPPEKDIFILREEADIERIVEEFRKEALQAAKYLGDGYEVPVSFEFKRSQEIERMEFRVVKDRPYDRTGAAWLKPFVNDILMLKMVAAERLWEDIHMFDTFGVGYRAMPMQGTPPPITPLPLDLKIDESHVSLDACEEVVPKQSPDAAEFTIWVFLKHHVDTEKDGFYRTTHRVKKGSMDVLAMKKVLVPLLWEKRLIDSQDETTFGLCIAAKSAEGPLNLIPGRLPLADNTTITVKDHQLLEVCKTGFKIELIIDPVSGMSKEYSIEDGCTVDTLRYLLASGNEQKKKRTAMGLPPKKKTDQPVNLDDDVILTKEKHSKLYLWTLVLPKAKAGAK